MTRVGKRANGEEGEKPMYIHDVHACERAVNPTKRKEVSFPSSFEKKEPIDVQ